MKVELSEKELTIIWQWYHAAAGESASIDVRDPSPYVNLIKKLGFSPDVFDEDLFA